MAEEIQHEQRSSITLKRSVKGEYGWEIHVYFDPADLDHDHREALNVISVIDVRLRIEYLEKP
jgi:hypothetical protein